MKRLLSAFLIFTAAALFAASAQRTFTAPQAVVFQAALRAARSDLGATDIHRTGASEMHFRLPLSAPASAPVKETSSATDNTAAPAKPISVRLTVNQGGKAGETVVSLEIVKADSFSGTAAPEKTACEETAYSDFIMGGIAHQLGSTQPVPVLAELLRRCDDEEAK